MSETQPTVDPDENEPDKTEPDPTVYVAMTYGGQVLGGRHHKSVDAALKSLTAAAVPGFVVPAVVPAVAPASE